MIHLVTGNPNKLKELQSIFPSELALGSVKLDLDEIQSLDPHEIARHKLRQAYEILRQPVIVEDVSAGLESMGGLPGPFVKFFQQVMGSDALYRLGGEGTRVKIICTMGYFDGKKEIIVDGIVEGTLTEPGGEGGFGFDVCVIPDGFAQTFAEMDDDLKNRQSHRYRAAVLLLEALRSDGVI